MRCRDAVVTFGAGSITRWPPPYAKQAGLDFAPRGPDPLGAEHARWHASAPA
jgi:hypothetical protein